MRLISADASGDDMLDWKEWLGFPGTFQELYSLEVCDTNGNRLQRVQSLDLDTGTVELYTSPVIFDCVGGSIQPVLVKHTFKTLIIRIGTWSKLLKWRVLDLIKIQEPECLAWLRTWSGYDGNGADLSVAVADDQNCLLTRLKELDLDTGLVYQYKPTDNDGEEQEVVERKLTSATIFVYQHNVSNANEGSEVIDLDVDPTAVLIGRNKLTWD